MRYLLDTVILLWSLNEPEKLNDKALRVLEDGNEGLYLSAASAWEIAIKSATGRLQLNDPPESFVPKRMTALGLRPLPITHSHALNISTLPPHHQDPFDRVLISQAILEDMVLMTADHLFPKYPVQIMWCGR